MTKSIYSARIEALYTEILGSLHVRAFSGAPHLWRVASCVANAKACSDRRDIAGVRIHLVRAATLIQREQNARTFSFTSIAQGAK